MSDLSQLGRQVRATQDLLSDEDKELREGRERFLADSPTRSFNRLAWGSGALAAVAAAVLALFFMGPAEMSFQVAGQASPARKWVSSSDVHGTPLTFSDGSTVLLADSARARVSRLLPNGATVQLSQGKATVSVVHRNDTDFRFYAGPYLVEVTGTRFILEWRPKSSTFVLDMKEGSVLVSGPDLEEPRPFITGQRVELSPKSAGARQSAEAKKSPLDGALDSPEDTAKDSPKAEALPQESAPGKQSHRAEQVKQGIAWADLARRGEHASAVQEAERQGLERILSQSSGAKLLLLADSAVYSGRAGLARRAFTKVRERFGSSSLAAQAAFGLGRLSTGSTAVRWLEAYLTESPSGPLAREALGRVIEVESASGNQSRAESAASRYISRFPSGPHAGLARKVIGAAH